jgi:hypothetical protein
MARNPTPQQNLMKKRILPILVVFSVMTFLAGCAWHVGGGPRNVTTKPTTGQQLIDLQKARDAGAISNSEYQAQKAKLLEGK